MKHLRTAHAALLRRLGRLTRKLAKLLPDAHVYGGLGLIAYGASRVGSPDPLGAVLAPLAAGVGLILIVRFGAR